MRTDKRNKNERRPDLSSMVYGKIPPQATEFEEALLGGLMIDKNVFDEISTILTPDSFYKDNHQRIYKAICELHNQSIPVDTLSVTEKLRESEVLEVCGGPYAIVKLTNSVISGAHSEHYAHIIQQRFIKRELIRISGEIISEAYEDSTDPFELLERAEKDIADIGMKGIGTELTHISTITIKAVTELAERRKNESYITGISSGYSELDKTTLGFQNGELIIIAGRPGQGKTAFALNIAANAAVNPKGKTPVAVWSLEMKATSLANRMFSARSGIPLSKIISGRISDDEMGVLYEKGIKVINGGDLYFDEKTGVTVQQIKSKARKYKRKSGLGLIIVDYLQLITATDGYNREQEISKISRELKELALELDIPIIALSQMSRDFEKRTIKIPQLSDLRESGAIEQDADMVIFIWEPTKEEKDNNADLNGKTRLRIAKQRNGMENFFICEFEKITQIIKNVYQDTGGQSPIGLSGNWKPVNTVTNFYEKDKDEEPF